MYRNLARLYDLIHADKDYRKEASLLHAVAQRVGRSYGRDHLDVGCGTGRHLEQLRRWYSCTGLDKSPAMLGIAGKRLPEVTFVSASMETFSLRKRFDLITLLFGTLGYARTIPRMERTVMNLAYHLKPGGVLLVAPWYTPSAWKGRFISGRIGQGPGVTVARVTRFSTPRPRISEFETHYLIGTRTQIRHVRDSQQLGLFRDEEVQASFTKAGLRSYHMKKFLGSANGLHVGVKNLD